MDTSDIADDSNNVENIETEQETVAFKSEGSFDTHILTYLKKYYAIWSIDKPKLVSRSQKSKADDLVFIKIAMSNQFSIFNFNFQF